MPSPEIRPRRLLAGLCAVLCVTACGGIRNTDPARATEDSASLSSQPETVKSDSPQEPDLETRFTVALSEASARATQKTLPQGDALLTALEEAGLDAGTWAFGGEPGEEEGLHVLARLVGKDWPNQVILLAAAGDTPAGVAGLLEVARGMGALVQAGWQPRRTLVLAAWDGEVPAREGAHAWLTQGPMSTMRSTLAMLTVDDGLAGDTFRIAATPDLRVLAARLLPEDVAIDPPAGRYGAGPFLAAGVSTVEIARRQGERPPRRQAKAHPDDIVAGARLWGILALRLSEALVPPHNLAVTAQRALTGLRDLEEATHAAFGGNPPPTKDLRVALLRLRNAGERWNNGVATVAEGDPEALETAWLTAQGAARMLSRGGGRDALCRNLLYCPAKESDAAAVFLPGLARAMAREDRSGYVTESLLLATAARNAGQRLAEATDLLPQPAEETP